MSAEFKLKHLLKGALSDRKASFTVVIIEVIHAKASTGEFSGIMASVNLVRPGKQKCFTE